MRNAFEGFLINVSRAIKCFSGKNSALLALKHYLTKICTLDWTIHTASGYLKLKCYVFDLFNVLFLFHSEFSKEGLLSQEKLTQIQPEQSNLNDLIDSDPGPPLPGLILTLCRLALVVFGNGILS